MRWWALASDLASPGDFVPRPDAEHLIEHIFSERERELAHELCPHDLPFAYAVLFGAKEPAFKATTRPLCSWYQTHDEELTFEVRDFGMEEAGLERGELRRGAAQVALERMDIGRIEVCHWQHYGMALVLALAYTK